MEWCLMPVLPSAAQAHLLQKALGYAHAPTVFQQQLRVNSHNILGDSIGLALHATLLQRIVSCLLQEGLHTM